MMDFDTLGIDLDGLQDLPIKWVKTDDELYDLIDEIDTLERVALDTEFIKRSSYFPILALVQVNTGKAIYLVDAPKLDLSEFWQALAEIPEMIWFACGEDLAIFYLLAQCPPLTNITDVQISMAYLTGELQIGYARALQSVLGVSLDKSESQSDWLARPLSEKQEHYAADDVRYLLALADVVAQQLADKSLTAFVKEDTDGYAKDLHQAQHTADMDLYLDYTATIYDRRQLGVLQVLVAWREALARSTNQPPSFIIGRQALREIVLAMPDNHRELGHTTIHRNALRWYGKEILQLIADVRALPDDKLPPLPPPTSFGKEKPYQADLTKAVDAQATLWQMPSKILLKSRWLPTLIYIAIYDKPEMMPAALLGYRHDWVVQVIIPLLAKHKSAILNAMAHSADDMADTDE